MKLSTLIDPIVSRQITMVFKNTDLETVMKFSIPISIVSLLLLIAAVLLRTQKIKKSTRKFRILSAIGTFIPSVILIISMMVLFCTKATTEIAAEHGRSQSDLGETIEDTWHKIDVSEPESKLPDDLTGAIIIYYRYGCPDCAATRDDIVESFRYIDNVYWIATRSETGVKLREKYPVADVPAGLVIEKNGEFAEITLYKKVDGKSVIDMDNVSLLISRAQRVRESLNAGNQEETP